MPSEGHTDEVMQIGGYTVSITQEAREYLKRLPRQLALFLFTPTIFGAASYYSGYDLFDIAEISTATGVLGAIETAFYVYASGLLILFFGAFGLMLLSLLARGARDRLDWAVDIDEVDDAAE